MKAYFGGSRDQDCRGIVGFCGGLESLGSERVGTWVGFAGAYEFYRKGRFEGSGALGV